MDQNKLTKREEFNFHPFLKLKENVNHFVQFPV